MIWGDLRQGDVIRDPDTGADWTIESIVGGNEVTGVVNVWVTNGTDHYNVKQPWMEPAAIVARLPESLEATRVDPLVVKGTKHKDDPSKETVTERLHVAGYNPPVVQDPELTKSLEEEAAAVQAAFGDDKLDLLAAETTQEAAAREGATKEEPLVLPPIDSALALRSHLYILHDVYVADLDPRGPSAGAALKEHHRKSHEDGPMKHPHTHEGTAT